MRARDLFIFNSQSPVIRRESGPFVRWTDLSDGLGVYGVVRFEREIVWLRNCHCDTIVLDAQSQTLDEPSGYCDHSYGYLSCVRNPFEDLPESLRRYGITPDGALSVVINLRVEESPAVDWPEESEFLRSRYSKRYRTIPQDWAYSGDAAFMARASAATVEERCALDPPAYLGNRIIFDGPLWSSRLGLDPRGQAETRDAAFQQAYKGLPDDEADKARDRMRALFPAPAPLPSLQPATGEIAR